MSDKQTYIVKKKTYIASGDTIFGIFRFIFCENEIETPEQNCPGVL